MTSGGKRIRAGRPTGKNVYGESTKPMRIPLSRIDEVKALLLEPKDSYQIPFFSSMVQAGFPSPADDHIEGKLDLNTHLIKHPAATFFVRATGDSMIHAGIQSGDILIVDRSLSPTNGKIVIAAIDGELTVKRLVFQNKHIQLVAENPNYPPIDITQNQDMVVWGVVTHVIHEA